MDEEFDWGTGALENYEKIKRIGEGTYGKVYKARNIVTNEFVALKKIKTFSEHSGVPVTTLREIKILKYLSHSNLVQIKEIVIDTDAIGKKKIKKRKKLSKKRKRSLKINEEEKINVNNNNDSIELNETNNDNDSNNNHGNNNHVNNNKDVNNSNNSNDSNNTNNDINNGNNNYHFTDDRSSYTSEDSHTDKENNADIIDKKEINEIIMNQHLLADINNNDNVSKKRLNIKRNIHVYINKEEKLNNTVTVNNDIMNSKENPTKENISIHNRKTMSSTSSNENTSENTINNDKEMPHSNSDFLNDIKYTIEEKETSPSEIIKMNKNSRLMRFNSRSNSIYIVLEYVDHDLTGLLDRKYEFQLVEIKSIMVQLLDILLHLHENGYVHRDIKCSNILLSNQHQVKLADFGLSRSYISKTNLTNRVVTLWYRSPELLLGDTKYDTSVDMWSLGCVLAELLIGAPLFTGKTEAEQINKIFQLCGNPKGSQLEKFPYGDIIAAMQKQDKKVEQDTKESSKDAKSLDDSDEKIETIVLSETNDPTSEKMNEEQKKNKTVTESCIEEMNKEKIDENSKDNKIEVTSVEISKESNENQNGAIIIEDAVDNMELIDLDAEDDDDSPYAKSYLNLPIVNYIKKNSIRIVTDDLLNLVGALLSLDPEDRLNAFDAINHPFFYEEPVAPANPIDLEPISEIPDSHEYETKAVRRKQKDDVANKISKTKDKDQNDENDDNKEKSSEVLKIENTTDEIINEVEETVIKYEDNIEEEIHATTSKVQNDILSIEYK